MKRSTYLAFALMIFAYQFAQANVPQIYSISVASYLNNSNATVEAYFDNSVIQNIYESEGPVNFQTPFSIGTVTFKIYSTDVERMFICTVPFNYTLDHGTASNGKTISPWIEITENNATSFSCNYYHYSNGNGEYIKTTYPSQKTNSGTGMT